MKPPNQPGSRPIVPWISSGSYSSFLGPLLVRGQNFEAKESPGEDFGRGASLFDKGKEQEMIFCYPNPGEIEGWKPLSLSPVVFQLG